MLRDSRTSKVAPLGPSPSNSPSQSTIQPDSPPSSPARFSDDFGFRPMSTRRRKGQSEPVFPTRPVPVNSGPETPQREAQSSPVSAGANIPTNIPADTPVTVGNSRPDGHVLSPSEPTCAGDARSGLKTDTDARARIEVLERLGTAAQIAKRNNRSVWDFSIEISELVHTGTHILRELICQGLVEHRRESVTESDQLTRHFTPEPELVLSDRSCFVITDAGLKYLQRETSIASNGHSNDHSAGTLTNDAPSAAGITTETVPRWDEEKRELWVGPYLIKRFRWPARNQLAIVREFHRLNWPTRISDPLPPSSDVDPKQRLHDTIKCLNRRRLKKLLKFGGDGTGTGVVFTITLEKD